MIVGVSALIVIIGVMNGLQSDLREKILIGSPDIRVLTYGEDMSMSGLGEGAGSRSAYEADRRRGESVRPWSSAHRRAGTQYSEGAFFMGIEPDEPGLNPVTRIRTTARAGNFTFGTHGRKAPRCRAWQPLGGAAQRDAGHRLGDDVDGGNWRHSIP